MDPMSLMLVVWVDLCGWFFQLPVIYSGVLIMNNFQLPRLSDEPSPIELEEFYSALIQYVGPNCDVSQFLGTIRHATNDQLFSTGDQEYDKHQFEIAYYSIPAEKDCLKSTINRLKQEVWGGPHRMPTQ
jgi:hypothetical protein